MKLRLWSGVALVLAGMVSVPGCVTTSGTPTADGFVGSAACQKCHQAEYRTWRDTWPNQARKQTQRHEGEPEYFFRKQERAGPRRPEASRGRRPDRGLFLPVGECPRNLISRTSLVGARGRIPGLCGPSLERRAPAHRCFERGRVAGRRLPARASRLVLS